jgi:WD40 repeat protein
VSSLAFSPNGNFVAAGGRDKSLRVFAVKTGKEVLSLAGHENEVLALAYSPDGKLLASAASSTEAPPVANAVKLWDVAGGDVKAEIKGSTGWFRCVAFSPDGKVLAAATTHGQPRDKVCLWDTATGKQLGTLEEDGVHTLALAFSSDGKTLVVGTDHAEAIRLWDWAARKQNGSLKVEGSCFFTAFSPDGKTLVTLSADLLAGSPAELTLWDFARSRPRKVVTLAKGWSPAGGQLAADGKTVAVRYRTVLLRDKKPTEVDKIELRDATTGAVLESLVTDKVFSSFAFSPRGRVLAVGLGGDGPARLVNSRVQPAGPGAVQLWEFPALTRRAAK